MAVELLGDIVVVDALFIYNELHVSEHEYHRTT